MDWRIDADLRLSIIMIIEREIPIDDMPELYIFNRATYVIYYWIIS